MESVRVFTQKVVFTLNDEFHEVHLFNREKKLKKGFAYIKGNYVYIYRGKLDKTDIKKLQPGVYLNHKGEYIFVQPDTHERELYHIDKVIEIPDLETIFKDISEGEENFISQEDIEIINNNSEMFIPSIKEDDDFLKYLVKMAITMKKTNLKNYRGKFINPYALNNMKSGLQKETKMTVTHFKRWTEILGLKWKLTIEDDGSDRLNPLPEPIEIYSEDF